MQTHNLRDLRNLHTNGFIETFRPGSRHILTQVNEEKLWNIPDIIVSLYHKTTRMHVSRIKYEMTCLYGRTFYIPGNQITDYACELKEIISIMDMSIAEIVLEIRKYMNYKCNFYRRAGKKFVPVEFSRIKQACIAIKEKKPPRLIEDILYF